MNLIVIDPNTKQPSPTGDILTIPIFLELWERITKLDGDRDGSKKRRNLQEYGYIKFNGAYDSKYRYMEAKEADEKIRVLLKLPDEWQPDEVVKECLRIYIELQETPTMELLDDLEGTNRDLKKWTRSKRALIADGKLDSKEVDGVLDVIDRLPKTAEAIKRSKEIIYQEQSTSTGRRGRKFAKFEMPEK